MDTLTPQGVIELCDLHGFALSGISKAEKTAHKVSFLKWLEESNHGEMGWMSHHVEVRLNPSLLVNGAQSIICVADRYGELSGETISLRGGKIARYARGKDYHKEMKRRLHAICDVLSNQYKGETFKACVDTAPLLEREFAANAGIGSIGKHTLLIEQGVGSWILLGAIVTTAKLEPTESKRVDPCASCTSCIDACPTDAITPWNVDARKCISYLTIEHRSEIETKYFAKMGNWLFGCDICQEVCPHNQTTERAALSSIHDAYKPRLESLDVLDVMNWNEEARREAFQGSALKRAKLGMIRRNAVIVAGNILSEVDDPELLSKLKEISADELEDSLVRNTAKEVLSGLGD